MSTGLVAYISVNAVTHPFTLHLQATHFAPWPTEGTLRVIALAACAASVGLTHYLHGGRSTQAKRQIFSQSLDETGLQAQLCRYSAHHSRRRPVSSEPLLLQRQPWAVRRRSG